MTETGLQCHGCGSTNVTFDSKRRILVCHQCGKEEYYSRATLNTNGKVVLGRQNAMKAFLEGKIDNAQHFAIDVINISMDNAPALYIIAYHEEFVIKRIGAMKRFFEQISTVALEGDEVEDIKTLLIASTHNMMDFEADVIRLLAVNMQGDEDKQELCNVIDKICPTMIARRTSAAFMTKELVEMYRELAEHCMIPKTCFALIKSIETNPDSPYVGNSFYLRAKTEFFYRTYVLPIGEVIEAMQNSDYKAKFLAAYKMKKEQYEQNMN